MTALPCTFHADGSTSLTPDLDQARAFLDWLGAWETRFTFQTFADTEEAKAEDKRREKAKKPPMYARLLHGTLEQHAAELERLNNAGAGVFVTVNETDLQGREVHNVKRVRAVFADTDGAPLEPIQAFKLAPSGLVESSPESWHPYWLCSELPLDKFKGVQWKIAELFKTDKAVNDLPRVMRLPGYWHRKAEPFKVRIIGELNGNEYSAEQILEAFPPLSKTPSHKIARSTAKAQPELNQYAAEPPQTPSKPQTTSSAAQPLTKHSKTLAGLSEHVCRQLLDGVAEGSRSDAIFGVAKDLIKLGLRDDQVAEILTEPTYGLSAKAYEGGRGARAQAIGWTLDHTVKNARADLDAELAEFNDNTPAAADIFGNLEPPAFPVDLLPPPVAAYARDQGELIGVDPAVIGMAALGAIAGCIDDRVKIQPKRHDPTWTESARLWVGIIGDPSAKKSPGISKALGHVRKIAAKWREDYAKALAKWQEECDELTKENKKAALPPAPPLKRLTASDVTVEKLGDILSKCEPRGILIDRDEMTGWLASMDAYKAGSGGKDKAAWLEAYNGGGMEIDRINRGSLWVENWSACVVGGIQPQVIQEYAHATNHDGMLQRFLLIHAAPARRGKDRYPDMDAKNTYTDLLEQIVGIKAGEHSVVKLSEGAHKVREAFNDKLHRAVLSMPNKHLTAMLGKWEGTFARLLLTYHVAECAQWQEYPTDNQVKEDTAQRVSDLLWRVLLPHAVKFYDGLDPIDSNARALAGLLLARGWERFTPKRDLHNNMLAYRKMRDWEREEMLDRLEAYGWIWPEPGGRLNERGKPVAYCVNQTIHERFKASAEAERERRAEVARIMADLKAG
ncbi:DUF3987 domain-containing protein [Halopseudomonas salegens]|uniref:RepB-like DNA primase domain-containing protein n=1 Tax=Halopseudomonas salegens TaxID=1434072 RepID=A0A1H2HBM3_9GAMM|nr:DUF3987 domain-containing protein [Halopseudomonas salegens]SDU29297.1 Protein of unknown function [Halopseudomonas salegens]